MSKIMKEENVIIDLTDDPPERFKSATTEPDIEYVGSRFQNKQFFPRKRKLKNSDVIIIEDNEPGGIENTPLIPQPQVACHFFFPTEEDVGESSTEGTSIDPLAPAPEWVDCCTDNTVQVPHGNELLAPPSLPEVETSSFALIDPLGITERIKIEPETEADVKPSIEQLSLVASSGKEFNYSPMANHVCLEKPSINVKKDLFDHKNPNDVESIPTSKLIDEIGPECSNSIPSSKLNDRRKVGPKCAKFRQIVIEEKNTNTRIKNTQNDDLNKKIPPPNQTNHVRLEKPKINVEKELLIDSVVNNSKSNKVLAQNNPCDVKSVLSSKLKDRLMIGRECSSSIPSSKLTDRPKVGPECSNSIPSSKLKDRPKVGPKCAKFKQKLIEEKNKINIVKNCQYDDISTEMPRPNQTIATRKVGPKCAKFRLQVGKTTEVLSTDMSLKKHLTQGIGSNIVSSIKPAIVSIGPKLPLPQCFHKKQSPMQELSQCSSHNTYKNNQPEENVDKDRIVLKIYTCFRCNYKCTDPLFHEEHVKICNAKRRCNSLNSLFQDCIKQNGFYKCEICTFKFKNQSNLSNHLNQHGVKGFICHICQLNFLTLQQLHQHIMTDHKNLERVYTCNVCEYSSQQIHHVKEHMIRHNKDFNLFCSPCRQNFEDTEDINNHRKEFHRKASLTNFVVKEDKKVIESECEGSNFLKKGKLSVTPEESNQVERSTGTRMKIEAPSESNYTTKLSDTVIKHFEAQTIERNGNYYCNGCCYKFKNIENLNKHKKHHLQHKPFSCCDDSFVSLSYLDYFKHVKENHAKNMRLTCICRQNFACRSETLGKHMAKHVSDGLFCHRCAKNFEDDCSFKSHLSANHANMSISAYNCTECSFSTPFQFILKRHMGRHKRKKISTGIWKHGKCKKSKVRQKTKNTERKNCDENVNDFEKSYNDLKPGLTTLELKLSIPVTLKEHIKHEHNQEQPAERGCDSSFKEEKFRCNKCSFKSAQVSVFIKHLKSGHKKQKFICNVCKSNFGFLKHYLRHMKNHAACAAIYSCNECKFTSRKHILFAKHMRTHTFKCCPLCDYKTQRLHTFINHVVTLHTAPENEHPSSNTSAVESRKTSTETYESTLENEIAKVHSCCFCAFKTTEIDSLRSHMAVHFNSSGISNDKEKLLIKEKLTVKGLKSKSVSTKNTMTNKLKGSKKSDEVGLIPCYCCSQCEFKRRDRKAVANHILNRHNIKGGVRNSAIKKIYVKTYQEDHMNPKNYFEIKKKGKNKGSLEIDHRLSSLPERNQSVPNELIKLKQMEVTDEIETKKIKLGQLKSSLPWKCLSCDLQKLSLLAQLQHKKYGHMGFWQRSFSCKKCGFRCADKGNLSKHLKWKHVENKVNEEQLNTDKISRNIYKDSNVDDSVKLNSVLIKHNKRKQIDILKCSKCNIESSSMAAQRQHRKLGHIAFWDKAFSCDLCGMRFGNQGGFCKHKIHRHHAQKTQLNSGKLNSFVTSKLKRFNLHGEPCKSYEEENIKNEVISSKYSSSTQDTQIGMGGFNSDDDEHYTCGECDFATDNVIEFSTHMFIHSGIPDD